MNLSKSRFTLGVRCEKLLWLSCYKKEEMEDLNNDNVFENGNIVGELARSLFGKYTLINYDENYEKMINDTKIELLNKPNIICEASFNYLGNFCSVDILKNDVDGIELYEVKSSTEVKDIYIDDASYQTWVLTSLGFNVKKAAIVYVNNKYLREEKFDINKYFNIKDITNLIDLKKVEEKVKKLKKIVNSSSEPDIDLSLSCHSPYSCPFFKYCTKKLPTPNIFDIGWATSFNKKLELYKKQIITYEDLKKSKSLNKKAMNQIEIYLDNKEKIIDKEKIKKLLDTFKFPLYFLDFESFQPPIPEIVNTHPYQQICFQYSLHYYLEENGTLFHKEFLSSDYDGNPMYLLCKRLCEDIPLNSCVLVYNDSFEKSRLTEMSDIFLEFRSHLINIRDNIIDLLPPFKNQDYYVKEMGGSASIKKVLPALFPNDESLDYHNLEQVHKGDEASSAFLSLKNLDEKEEKELRENMLIYCSLDTYAMVKIYEKLKEVVNQK